jgi:DNA repair exonuclease SbcCD ATPase subunit
MDFVSRLLLREEIDALDNDLAEARQAETLDVKRIRELEAEIERLEERYATARRAEID